MAKPRCSRCGRVLKDPASIARGMGPVCAGSGGSSSGKRRPRIRRPSGRRYALVSNGHGQLPLFAAGREFDDRPKPLSKRARITASKERRRELFQNRMPFQCGLNARTREPIIYSPTPGGGWINSEGYATSHASLEKYLKTYGWI